MSLRSLKSLLPASETQETPPTYGRWLSPDDAVLRPFFPVQHFFVYQFCNKTKCNQIRQEDCMKVTDVALQVCWIFSVVHVSKSSQTQWPTLHGNLLLRRERCDEMSFSSVRRLRKLQVTLQVFISSSVSTEEDEGVPPPSFLQFPKGQCQVHCHVPLKCCTAVKPFLNRTSISVLSSLRLPFE